MKLGKLFFSRFKFLAQHHFASKIMLLLKIEHYIVKKNQKENGWSFRQGPTMTATLLFLVHKLITGNNLCLSGNKITRLKIRFICQ